jgi:hypothetical protein
MYTYSLRVIKRPRAELNTSTIYARASFDTFEVWSANIAMRHLRWCNIRYTSTTLVVRVYVYER